MKAISLWQPWASLITTGAKKWETRSWPTKYRGSILIHASARRNVGELIYYTSCWTFQGSLAPLIGKPLDLTGHGWPGVEWTDLPLGVIVGKADLIDCKRTDDMTQAEIGTDRPFGDFNLGRYALRMENAVRFEKPIPWKMRQTLFNVPDDCIMQNLCVSASLREDKI